MAEAIEAPAPVQQAPRPPDALDPNGEPATPAHFDGGATSSSAIAAASGGVVLSETQLGNMALRAKQQRTKAEQDKQLLQNRISRLIVEQEKAEKRIAETRRRAMEIQNLKQRNAANSVARSDATAWLSSEQDLQKELLRENRATRAKAITSSRTAMYALRKDEVQVLKHMRRENEQAVQAQRELELQRAVERKNIVREHQRLGSQRKQAEQAVQLSKLKEAREGKRQELDEDALTHLSAYSSLAEEEQRLIASLQKWQSVQEEAFEQLDTVLGASKTSSQFGSRAGSARPGSRPVSRGALPPGGLAPHPPPAPAPASE